MKAVVFRNSLRFFVLVSILMLVPRAAEAWGPGVHYYLGSQLLKAGAIAAPLSLLVEQYTKAFLYGNVVADIVVGKNMLDIEDHSHHWSVGRTLRRNAENAAQEALAIGYWTHLAADTVAHNVFLRRQQEKGFSSKRLGHAYWEMQAENWVPETYHREVNELLDQDFTSLRQYLEDSIPRTVLPHRMNWLIMDGMMHFSGHGTSQSFFNLVERYSSARLKDSEMDDYMQLCENRMEESLDGFENRITRLNPIGKGNRFLP